ncbi:unnamed protein product [Cylicocyclus nassatus]|uniref:Serine palmitoyltransferase 1 n=1 Tax=Cylicocyclus nassatus TaxID=53992 RepID=A0AA36H617_CYLNA|nr:unnamed protein product [Cylicocyclus nassatus]
MPWREEYAQLLSFLDACSVTFPLRTFNNTPEKDFTSIRRIAFALENMVLQIDQLKKPLVPSTQALAQSLVCKFNGLHRRLFGKPISVLEYGTGHQTFSHWIKTCSYILGGVDQIKFVFLLSIWVPYLHYYVEAILVATVVYLFINRRNSRNQVPKLTEEQKDAIIAAWQPEPLVPGTPQDHPVLNQKFADGKMTKYVKIEGKEYLNMATSNFLGFVGEKRIEEVAKKTIQKYGVGSCGPRGFYGTVDVHLNLEAELAKFMGCEEAVLYSYAFATVASAIPAYAKRGDIIFVDKGVNFAIQKGLQACRSRIEWFEHNDMEDLERLLEEQDVRDKKDPKKAKTIRRFIIVEGLYVNTADLCPLPRIMEFKWKYKVRVFIDESWSFGVIGKTGRGVTEYYGVPIIDVDMVMGSLENAMASTGGFCVGRSYVVGHQRLSGLGYCFSASLPPLLATAASEGLRMIEEQPERIERLQRLAVAVHRGLLAAFEGTKFGVQGVEISPMKHVMYNGEDAEKKLDMFVDKLFDEASVMITRARYLEHDEMFPIKPSARVMVQSEMTDEEVERALVAIAESDEILKMYKSVFHILARIRRTACSTFSLCAGAKPDKVSRRSGHKRSAPVDEAEAGIPDNHAYKSEDEGSYAYEPTPAKRERQTPDEAEPAIEPSLKVCDIDPRVTYEGGKYMAEYYVPSAFHGKFLGLRGDLRQEIEESTDCQLKIPKKGQTGNVEIESSVGLENVQRCLDRLELLLIDAKKKAKVTHFIAIPCTAPEIVEAFEKFKEAVTVDERIPERSRNPKLFTAPLKLHITVCVLWLFDEEEQKKAADVIEGCRKEIIATLPKIPYEVEVNGVEGFDNKSTNLKVLYGGIHSEALQNVCDLLRRRLVQAGMSPAKEKSKSTLDSPVRMHMTLMKSTYANRRKPKAFDAKLILDDYKDYHFGTFAVDKIYICSMQGIDKETGFYQKCYEMSLL